VAFTYVDQIITVNVTVAESKITCQGKRAKKAQECLPGKIGAKIAQNIEKKQPAGLNCRPVAKKAYLHKAKISHTLLTSPPIRNMTGPNFPHTDGPQAGPGH
jgi:hypothetical protein